MKPINPFLPLQYQNEVDYRNIPRHYLNNNIPQGRGMIKWAPFSTMPQQYENIAHMIENQHQIDKPILSEDQCYEINVMLRKYMGLPSSCTIRVYNNGYLKDFSCIIDRVDEYNRRIHVYLCDYNEHDYIELGDIIEVF